ncbi:MAG TPA: glycoside hydrolase family 38 C-terminal domain-containing protein [Dehalococcoidia bacterium]|nr:glycoside hydrolase family 38 C-terminal domain-containing protein [Dehalococcoidia bacterium]
MTSSNLAPYKFVVVSHSHWDREWYQTYESFRVRLVGMVDRLIDLLNSDPDYRCFTLDGQAVTLEDYLEIRPERRDDLERLVREGRLLIGPWYILADELLAGGESLVRNMFIGSRIAGQFGPVMPIGYAPDAFGHPAHMPAILNGFGIKLAAFWRGAADRASQSEFRWRSPDGSEVVVLHFPHGYSGLLGLSEEPAESAAQLQAAAERLAPLASGDTVLLMNGGDHVEPQANLGQAIRLANEASGRDDTIRHGSLLDVATAIDHYRDSLSTVAGELRAGKMSPVLHGVTSTRMWIKQSDFATENLLLRWAEPFAAWGESLRAELGPAWVEPWVRRGPLARYPTDPGSIRGLLKQAWKLLLKNQPHDSICGCSIDETHEEMKARYSQSQWIAEELTRQPMRMISRLVPPLEGGGAVVFNPSVSTRSDFVTVVLRETDDGVPVAFVGPNGERLPCEITRWPTGENVERTADYIREGEVEVGFVPRGLPSLGYQLYRAEYGSETAAHEERASRIANEFFEVAIKDSGALTIRDLRSGRRYSGVNRFVDSGDAGDEYNFDLPVEDFELDAPSSWRATAHVGPARQRLVVDATYTLPAELEADRRSRSAHRIPTRIVTAAVLYSGVPRVDFETTVENASRDHRLRVLFPAGFSTEESLAEQHFGVIERSNAVADVDPDDWIEDPPRQHPHKTFVALQTDGHGILVANRGLPEYEIVERDGQSAVAITLLRCVGWLSRDDLRSRRVGAGPPLPTPGAQMLGRHAFAYSFIPYSGTWQDHFPLAHQFATPLQARAAFPASSGLLPASASLIEIDNPRVVVTAVKPVEDGPGFVVRLVNYSDLSESVTLTLRRPWFKVVRADLNEQPIEELSKLNEAVRLHLTPHELTTLLFKAPLD